MGLTSTHWHLARLGFAKAKRPRLTAIRLHPQATPWLIRSRIESLAYPLDTGGDPMEQGKAAVFLASSMSDFVTGAYLPVDGGWLTLLKECFAHPRVLAQSSNVPFVQFTDVPFLEVQDAFIHSMRGLGPWSGNRYL